MARRYSKRTSIVTKDRKLWIVVEGAIAVVVVFRYSHQEYQVVVVEE